MKNAIPMAIATVFTVVHLAAAQQVGDRIVATTNFDTKIYKEKVGKVYGGEIHTIIAIEENWCAVDGVKGWLPLRNVMDLESARKYYSQRIEDKPDDDLAFAHRGMIHFETGDYAKAFTDLNSSLRIKNDNPANWNNRGRVLYAQGKHELALKDIGYAIRLNPEYKEAHFNLGLILNAVGRHKDAVQSFNNAITLDRKNPWYFISRGSARLSTGDSDGADADYDYALKMNKDLADAYVGKSNVYLGKNELQKSLQLAQKAIDLQPRNTMALNTRGWCRYRLGQLDDALADLNLAVQLAPELPIAFNNRGVVFAAKKNYPRAIQDYTRSIELAGGKSPVAQANRGTAWFGEGDFAKAKSDYEQALRDAPNLPDALNAHAWFQSTCPVDDLRDGKAAVTNSRRACELSQWKNWSFIDTLAAAEAEAGNYQEAVKVGRKALAEAPADRQPEIRSRIDLYENRKPYRASVGKTAGSGS